MGPVRVKVLLDPKIGPKWGKSEFIAKMLTFLDSAPPKTYILICNNLCKKNSKFDPLKGTYWG